MKIIDKENRNKLTEGRTSGMGFAFLKRDTPTVFKTVQPISACKDFLNEILFAEKTGILLPSVYGLKYKKVLNIFNRNYAFIGIKILPHRFNGPNKNDDRIAFNKNYHNLQNFMNQIEEGFKIRYNTKIIKANEDMFVVKMPIFWTNTLYLLSLYTLLLRAYQAYDNSLPAIEYIEKGKCYHEDINLMYMIKKRLPSILAGDLPKQEFADFDTKGYMKIHNNSGICEIVKEINKKEIIKNKEQC